MKTKLSSILGMAICAVLLSLAAQTPANASLAQYPNVVYADNFSSDIGIPGVPAGWTPVNIFALSTGQTWDASTGAYRMTAPANGFNPGNGKYGFVGSVVTGLTLGDGYVQSDVVTWQGPGLFGAFGVGSRLGNLGTPLGLTGYAIVYEPYGHSLAGDLRLENLGPPGTFNSLGALNVTLIPGNQYTFTLETSGSSIIGSLWDVGQVGTSLVGQISATDSTYASGSVGMIEVTQAPINPLVDTTWDNFLVAIPEPGTGLLLGLGLAGFLAGRRVFPKRS
jgi:hypothetical protein